MTLLLIINQRSHFSQSLEARYLVTNYILYFNNNIIIIIIVIVLYCILHSFLLYCIASFQRMKFKKTSIFLILYSAIVTVNQ